MVMNFAYVSIHVRSRTTASHQHHVPTCAITYRIACVWQLAHCMLQLAPCKPFTSYDQVTVISSSGTVTNPTAEHHTSMNDTVAGWKLQMRLATRSCNHNLHVHIERVGGRDTYNNNNPYRRWHLHSEWAVGRGTHDNNNNINRCHLVLLHVGVAR